MGARIHITEKDAAGAIRRRHEVSHDSGHASDKASQDIESHDAPSFTGKVTRKQHQFRTSWFASVKATIFEIFLPAGFPASVAPDYINYQIYDSLQAFCSTIAGLLSSRAVLEGFGVGDQNASATNAVLVSTIRDAVSNLASITFAWHMGTALEPEVKLWRLSADFLNDSAIVIDCLSPALTTKMRVLALCSSGILRALCGVAAGGSKAALSVHFAKTGNIGELNAKDRSQETVLGLIGMLTGSMIVPYITTRTATWFALMLLLIGHLSANYLAVRSVIMTTLNRQRAGIVYTIYKGTGAVLSPIETSHRERIFETDGALKDSCVGMSLGTCHIGTSLNKALASTHLSNLFLDPSFMRLFEHEQYILAPDERFPTSSPSRRHFHIWFKDKATASDHLKAWFHAIELSRTLASRPVIQEDVPLLSSISSSMDQLNDLLPTLINRLQEVGWKTDVGAIVTKPSNTVHIDVVGDDDKKIWWESSSSAEESIPLGRYPV